MDPGDREKDIIVPKLKAQLQYCYSQSTFYKQRFDEAGFDPDKLNSVADLKNVPILYKDDLRAAQNQHPPYGDYLCIEPESVFRIHGTSGTTGRPTYFGISRDDWERIGYAHARIMWSFGIRPSHKVFIGSFFSNYMGSWGALIGAERMRATVFPFGAGVPGQTERSFEWLASLKPEIFYGTPSYALYMGEKARASGYNPEEFGFKVLFFSGEPGAGIPATKKKIEDLYGGICIDCGSTSEMSPWMTNAETADRLGMLLWDDLVYTEIVHPDTKEPVADGEDGILVYTHLERDSQPMIRFYAGDITRREQKSNPCGRTYARLPDGLFGRADDMITIRGENVYLTAIEDVLVGDSRYGGEFRAIVDKKGSMDELTVQSEMQETDEDTQKQLAEKLRVRLGVRVNVELLTSGQLERTEFKAKRLIDRRK